MSAHTDRLELLLSSGVVAVLRGVTPDQAPAVAQAVHDGGVTAIEITVDTPGAVDMIRSVAAELPETAIVGAGTVLDAETARATMLAGAEFVVSPTVSTGVIEICNRYGVPVVPGAATPTEAVTATEAGADVVKVFPAAALGPDYVRSVRGPLSHIPLLPTGGITADNAGAFIEAGGVAVGVGSAIVDPDRPTPALDDITANAEALVESVAAARNR